MKKLFTLLPILLIVGCASGHVNVSTQMPSNNDLEIVIKTKKNES